MSSTVRSRRVPRLAVAAWVLAGAILVALIVAVAHYLGTPGGTGGMSGHAHTGEALYRAGADPMRPLLGTALVTVWHLDAVALAVLVLVAAWYLTGVALVPVRHPGTRWPVARTISFLAGLAVCALATNGSIAVYDQVLFTAHMIGHLALLMVAPALLMWGRPLTLALAASAAPRRVRIERIARGRVVSLLTSPPVALASYTVAIVGTHLTGLMDTVMRTTWAGQVEHLVYVLVGCQFFSLILGDEPIRWRLASPARWLLLAVAMAVDTFTGVVLLQQTRPVAMLSSPDLAVGALSDTHTGGAIMWFGGDAIMALIMIVLVIGWLRRVEASDEKGWLEQARRATFSAHTGAATPESDAARFDDDDAARSSYNEWLAQLDRQR
ncbi:MAG: copper resistance protein [Pseudonocardiales bacterium]|jgi:putative copper resistance protein D|nr:copper resistance protein [Pseudonocardiales bacterium]